MAQGRRDERVEGVTDTAAGLTEAFDDVGGDVAVLEALEPHRNRLAVERPLPVLEEPAHQARLRAGEDERGDLTLELDVAAQQRVHVFHLRDVLELVEHDQRPEAAALLVAAAAGRAARAGAAAVSSRVDLKPGADSERAERQPEARV